MKHTPIASLLLLIAAVAFAENRPVLVVYDFTSTFDEGKMGAWAAEIVRGHAQRSTRYIGNPKITVDEVLRDNDFRPTVVTDPAKLAEFTRRAFDADLFIYGSVEQRGEEDYRVRFRVYRVDREGKTEKVLDETKDCPGKRFVPLAVDEVLNALAGLKEVPAEWKLLADELRAWSGELAAIRKTDLDIAALRERAAAQQDVLLARFRNVTARTHVDAANRALLDYLNEVLDAQRELQKTLTKTDADASFDHAARLSRLCSGLARSIDHWLDDASAEKRWKEGKNLVINGGFEFGQKDPANWEPLKAHMSWVEDPDGKSGKVLKYDMPEDIAATYGMLLYSEPIRVEPGATYRLRWRFKTMAPAVKLFIKGYDAFDPAEEFAGQDREIFRSRKDPQYGPRVENEYERGKWTEYGHDFVPFVVGREDPKTGRYVLSAKQPKYIRLMLYAYWPKGVVYWDDIVVKKIKDAPIRPTE